jgi:hypothetical protein
VTLRPLDWELGQANGDMNDRSRVSNSSRMDIGMVGPLSLDAFEKSGFSEIA